MMRRAALALVAGLSACAQAAPKPAVPAATPTYQVRIAATYPHDPQAFTQGLFWLDGRLYESTGQIGRSTIREVTLNDGRVVRSTPIPPGLFGEGIVNWGPQIISITWQGGTGFRWDRKTFRQLGSFRYPGEGWGLTQNGRDLIMSDGTAELRFLDPKTLTERRRLTVTDRGRPVDRLNELEWVNGEVFANVWQTSRIARIDPRTGAITGWIELAPLVAANGDSIDAVLNGIAYDATRDRLFVTGKYWPRLYEVDLVAPAGR